MIEDQSQERIQLQMHQKLQSPVDEQVLLHPETVGPTVAPAAVAVSASRGPRLSGIGRRILIVAVQIRQLSAFTS